MNNVKYLTEQGNITSVKCHNNIGYSLPQNQNTKLPSVKKCDIIMLRAGLIRKNRG